MFDLDNVYTSEKINELKAEGKQKGATPATALVICLAVVITWRSMMRQPWNGIQEG